METCALPFPGGIWHHGIHWLVGFTLGYVESVVFSVTFHCCVVYLFCHIFSIIEISVLVVLKGVGLAVHIAQQ